MAQTNDELKKEIEQLQDRVKSLQDGFEKFQRLLLDLVETKDLKVNGKAQISNRDIGQTLDLFEQKLNDHDGTLSTHEGRLNSHDVTLSTHEGRLNSHDVTLSTHEVRLNSFSQSISIPGDIQFGATLSTTGRMHINGGESLFLLHKDGVIIGREWGGNGNLQVQGEIKGKPWYSNEYTLAVPNNGVTAAVKMLPADKCLAFITFVAGSFAGAGEQVWVEVRPDGFWYLCGHALQDGVSVKARCIGTD